jgi:hypothetical protein
VTGRDAATAVLKLIGVLAPGEDMDNSDAEDCLASLNRMLGTWANQRLMIPVVVQEEFSLTTGDQEYSMGSGANFDTSRPVGLQDATIEDQSQSPTIEYPLTVLTASEWASIAQKESGNSIPTHIYLEPSYPNATVHLYPKPQANLKVVLYSLKPLTALALDTEISLAPGYEDAIVSNGALRVAPEYGKTPDAMVIKMAADSMSAIKTVNHRPRRLSCDPALVRGPGRYNILTGGYE